MIRLNKTHTREHSLLYGFVWMESDYRHISELWGHNIKNFLVLKNSKSQKLEGWYDLDELEDIYSWVAQKATDDKDFFDLVKKRFYQYLNPLIPYLDNKKKLLNFRELKEYYNNWLHWWSPMDSFLLIPEFKVPEKIKQEALSIREKTDRYTDSLDTPVINFLNAKFPRYKEIIELMLPDEIFLLENRALTKEEIFKIKTRERGCAIFRGEVYSLRELESRLKKENLTLLEENSVFSGLLKGMPAYMGHAEGKVRLILHKDNISKLKKDEVLVADMTSPTFIPAIRKASAIITDEGGITCHAAIAAREFKLPCVVGTKIATQVLKDGDLVEVDANKGEVRLKNRLG